MAPAVLLPPHHRIISLPPLLAVDLVLHREVYLLPLLVEVDHPPLTKLDHILLAVGQPHLLKVVVIQHLPPEVKEVDQQVLQVQGHGHSPQLVVTEQGVDLPHRHHREVDQAVQEVKPADQDLEVQLAKEVGQAVLPEVGQGQEAQQSPDQEVDLGQVAQQGQGLVVLLGVDPGPAVQQDQGQVVLQEVGQGQEVQQGQDLAVQQEVGQVALLVVKVGQGQEVLLAREVDLDLVVLQELEVDQEVQLVREVGQGQVVQQEVGQDLQQPADQGQEAGQDLDPLLAEEAGKRNNITKCILNLIFIFNICSVRQTYLFVDLKIVGCG